MNPFELSTEEQLELIEKVTGSDEYELTTLAKKVEELELKIKSFKELEQNYKNSKEDLRQKMLSKGIKTWTLNSGTKITAIEDTPSKDNYVTVFCEKLFKEEHPDLYKEYLKEINDRTSPRKGSLRITLAKGDEKK